MACANAYDVTHCHGCWQPCTHTVLYSKRTHNEDKKEKLHEMEEEEDINKTGKLSNAVSCPIQTTQSVVKLVTTDCCCYFETLTYCLVTLDYT